MGMTRYGYREAASMAMRGGEGAAARNRQFAACSFIHGWSQEHGILEACGAFEWVALSYLGLSGALMFILHRNLARPALHITVHFGVFAAILVIVNAADRVRRGELPRSRIARTLAWVRDWYPQAVFLFCFEELQLLVHLTGQAWRDPVLIALDHRLTGVYPGVWFSQFSNPWINEAMQVAYMTYYLFLTILGASLYRRRRSHSTVSPAGGPTGAAALRAFWTVMTASMLAYSIGYVISIFFPVEAPFFAMRSFQLPPLAGGPATSLINFIEHWGRVRGGAFPSGHVTGAFVALLGAWSYRRYLFWVFLPCFVAMCVSTIYGRYHYIADVFAGILVGAVGFVLAERLMAVPGANPAERSGPQTPSEGGREMPHVYRQNVARHPRQAQMANAANLLVTPRTVIRHRQQVPLMRC
jgi:membrane-associated phospholipid phosphatase